jgi:integrase/recombinase XerD
MKNIGKKRLVSPPVGQSPQTVQLPAPKPAKPQKTKKPQRTELDETMYLEPDEIARLFEAIKTKRDRAIFRIVYHRGLRAHEVALIEYGDFRDRDQLLYVRRGKGSVSRQCLLIREELLALRAWIKERGTKPGPMFPSRQGNKGITRTRLDQLMKDYCRAAGIAREKAHMHALKHSCATHLIERGNSTEVVQDWLGHRDHKSTEIYKHFSARRRRDAVEKNADWK